MATDTQKLSSRQKELVAVGASIGAGCHPCVDHHLQAGAQVGLNGEQLLVAVAGAERIAAEATVFVADHAREQLGQAATPPATLTSLDDALAAFGAALGANDAAAIDLQMRAALDLGVARSQLREAIETTRNVQENAARIHVRGAERLLDSLAVPASASEVESDPGCGCRGSDQAEAAETNDPAGEASNVDDEAPRPANDRGAAMMAHCREMFGGLFGESDAPARADEPPVATGAQGCSARKEVRR